MSVVQLPTIEGKRQSLRSESHHSTRLAPMKTFKQKQEDRILDIKGFVTETGVDLLELKQQRIQKIREEFNEIKSQFTSACVSSIQSTKLNPIAFREKKVGVDVPRSRGGTTSNHLSNQRRSFHTTNKAPGTDPPEQIDDLRKQEASRTTNNSKLGFGSSVPRQSLNLKSNIGIAGTTT